MCDKVVFITGVSGGIGGATASRFKESGWRVIGASRRAPKQSITDRFFEIDMNDVDVICRVFREIKDIYGKIDAVVNNAAFQLCKPLFETAADEWDKVMAVNVKAAFIIIKEAYPLMKNKGGSIVNVGSVHALATSKNIAAYAASKGALLALTRALALELAPKIRVNVVIPGAINTEMLAAGLSRGHLGATDISERMEKLAERHPLGRVGDSSEVAEAILFLVDGKRSSFITGQSLVVDGGATARLSTE